MLTTRPRPARPAPVDDLGPALVLARMDCAATLSAQVAAVVEEAARSPRRATDPGWWVRALAGPGRALDEAWDRLAGPPVRRARTRPRSWRPVATGRHGVTGITSIRSSVGAIAVTDRAGPSVLADAAVAVLPGPPVRRAPRIRTRRRAPGSGLAGGAVSGAVLPGGVLSGSLVSGAVGVWRALPGSGFGTLLVLLGLLLVTGAAVAARIRTLRMVRARALAERVREAVCTAAGRELVRRSLAAERAAGPVAVRHGTGRAA